MRYVFVNATLILPDITISDAWLLIEDGIISAYGIHPNPHHNAPVIDCHGAYIMPGIIDLHCDTIEKMVQPRPGVHIDTHVALHITDRLLVSSGITSEYHSLSLDDAEFGVRNEHFIREFLELIAAHNHATSARHYVHARVEVSSERGAESLRSIIDHSLVKLVSIMDHSPGQGQYPTDELFRAYVAKTTGRDDAEIDAIIAKKHELRERIPQNIERVIELSRNAHIPIATHDDDTASKVVDWVGRGIGISEFPTTMEAAATAHQHGMLVGMGAPNVLRGKSSGGNISATDVIKSGYVDWLCSDYYPAAMLPAAFKLADTSIVSLSDAVNMITYNPARAIGIQNEYGAIQVGAKADLLVVHHHQQTPLVERVFIDGKQVYHVQPK
jgi:alpha-D-ribose 1-methylphosphonate 5-triphosphate diphosphatase